MKISNYKNFLYENINPIMRYYSYDWDDNILLMPTVIHMEHFINNKWTLEDVSTVKFSKIRHNSNWRFLKNSESFTEFRDIGPRKKKAFIEDLKIAIQNKSYGPSWNNFIHCLISGSIFAIITARGHESKSIKKGIKYIIKNVLTKEEKNEMAANLIEFKYKFSTKFDIMKNISFEKLLNSYLNKCDFIGISSPSFRKKYFNISNPEKYPEKAKKIALNHFINKINFYGKQINSDIRIGFSDDDKVTVNKIKQHFNDISQNFQNILFSVIDTSNPDINGGIKNKIN
jgi:hypothetical protein